MGAFFFYNYLLAKGFPGFYEVWLTGMQLQKEAHPGVE